MVLKKIIDRPKGVVGLHEIPSSKTILVCADGIVKGLVSKVYQPPPRKYKYRIQWANGHFTDLMALSDLVSRYQADGYTFMVEIEQGEPLQEIVVEKLVGVGVEDIKDSDLVLVKKNGEIVGTVQYYDDSYFIATSMSEFKAYRKTLRCYIEEGHSKGYSFWLQV